MIKRLMTFVISLSAAAAFAAVDVNTASPADLDSIKGIGPGTSAKILEVRKVSRFKDWADLIERLPGIGEKRAVKLSAEGLTVNGESFKPVAAVKSTAAEKPAKPAAPAPVKQ